MIIFFHYSFIIIIDIIFLFILTLFHYCIWWYIIDTVIFDYYAIYYEICKISWCHTFSLLHDEIRWLRLFIFGIDWLSFSSSLSFSLLSFTLCNIIAVFIDAYYSFAISSNIFVLLLLHEFHFLYFSNYYFHYFLRFYYIIISFSYCRFHAVDCGRISSFLHRR